MKFVPDAISRTIARQGLLASKNSPSILFGVGVVGMVGSTVLACRATLKVEDMLRRTQNDLETARSMQHEEYSEKDRKKDVAIIYTRSVFELAKMYGPSIIVGSLSVAALTKSHNLLSERNAALTAAYTAVDQAFNRYRERVVEKYGEDQDREFRHGSQEVDVVNEDTGKIETRVRVGDETPSMYARFFDQMSSNWSKEPEYNLVFLRCQQNWFNDLLKARGHVFLNEVYDALDIPRTKAGQVVGWIMSDEGDNYIDFDIWNGQERTRDFVNGREGAILLDFNVDGVIFDKIGNPEEGKPWQR